MTQLLHRAGREWTVALLWEPRDLWLGLYWNPYEEAGRRWVALYICLLPCLPIRLDLRRRG